MVIISLGLKKSPIKLGTLFHLFNSAHLLVILEYQFTNFIEIYKITKNNVRYDQHRYVQNYITFLLQFKFFEFAGEKIIIIIIYENNKILFKPIQQ